MPAYSKNLIVYLQNKDDGLLELGSDNVLSTSIELETDGIFDQVARRITASFSFVLKTKDALNFIDLASIKKSGEWRCPFCGHINKNSYRICGEDDPAMGCGHPKTKITDIIY